MARVTVGSLGIVASMQNKTSGTTFTLTANQDIPAGTFLILAIAHDNHASTTAPTITYPDPPTTSQIWSTRLAGGGQGVTTTAGSGIWLRWRSVRTNALIPSGTSFGTFTLSSAVVAKAAIIVGLTGVINTPSNGATSTSQGSAAGTPTTVTNAVPDLGDVVIGVVGAENPTITGDSDTLNGSWSTLESLGTSGSTAATNVCIGVQYKQITASGDQTYNPTSTADTRVSIQAFQTDEAAVPTIYGIGIPI